MKWSKMHKTCPCCKGEYCTNGLSCEEENCFLHNVIWLTKPCLTWIDSKNVKDYLTLAVCGIGIFS